MAMDLARIRHNAARYVDHLYARRYYSEERDYLRLSFLPRLIKLIDSEPERREKIMRWYGFAQGALWVLGEYSVDELKEHSNPDAPLMGGE
jgi:hypothetical protein